MEVFGDRVRRARIAQGWATYRAADKATGISVSTWQNIEARGVDPRLSTVQRLLEVLDVPAEELLSAPVALGVPVPTPADIVASRGASGANRRRRGRGSEHPG